MQIHTHKYGHIHIHTDTHTHMHARTITHAFSSESGQQQGFSLEVFANEYSQAAEII